MTPLLTICFLLVSTAKVLAQTPDTPLIKFGRQIDFASPILIQYDHGGCFINHSQQIIVEKSNSDSLSVTIKRLLPVAYRAKRKAWRPSKIADDWNKLLTSNVGKHILLHVENPENYYDTTDELPKPFIARLEGTTTERLLDQDIEFDQLFILLSNPRHLTGESIFNEYNFDYEVLVEPLKSNYYKVNFNTVIKIGVQKKLFWHRVFKKKNGS